MRRTAKLDRPADVLRPFAWTAIIAFCVGFYGYLALAPLLAS
jgi:hypothetical protein